MKGTILLSVLAVSALLLAASSGTSASAAAATSAGPADAPSFSFSRASLHAGVLPRRGLIKAAKRTLQFYEGSDLTEQSWFSVPDYKLSKRCDAARTSTQQTYHGYAYGGYVAAHDSAGRLYGTGFFDLGHNATVRMAIARADKFFGECSPELRGETRFTVSKSSTRGGFGLRARGTVYGMRNAVLYQTIAGYGNVFLYGYGPDQASADRVIAAERRYLDSLAPSQ